MIGDIVGIAFISKKPEFTDYLFGDVSEIGGKALKVLEKNEDGDCLCIDHVGKNLVCVDKKDIVNFLDMPKPPGLMGLVNPLRTA